jgi:tetratricopeptide (TPR) repeat protein
MAKNQKDRQRAKQKKLNRRKKRVKRAQSRQHVMLEPSNKVARKLIQCYDLIEEGDFLHASSILDRLLPHNSRVPDVIETQIALYQEMGDHERCSAAAKRYLQLAPKIPEAWLTYAQESMFCGRASIALLNYREFLRRYPNNENAWRVQEVIKLCETECRARIEKSRKQGYFDVGFDDGGLELFAKHEDSLAEMGHGNFQEAIKLCEQVLEIAPNFLSTKNNLASCCFQNGELEKAVALARKTFESATDNSYAQANLIKFEFLTGNPQRANELADLLVAHPPTGQDQIAASTEALSYLGRDQDVIQIGGKGAKNREFDPELRAIIFHHLAVARFRQGNKKAARRDWENCLELMPQHHEAARNLHEIEVGSEHSAWAEPIGKWLPESVLKNWMSDDMDRELGLVQQIPALKTLIPALLDRGDPEGREFALGLALASLTPEMIEIVREFGLGNRGSANLRSRALHTLYGEGHCEAGPHPFFSHGRWTEVELLNPEITDEPLDLAPAWQQQLLAKAQQASERGDYDKAEQNYQKILDRQPDSYYAEYNLATVWLNRDGEQGKLRAEKVIRRIAQEHPNYKHAKIALAQFASLRNDFDESSRLLGEVLESQTLHVSEATALFSTQAQIALLQENLAAAENALVLLERTAGEDHPVTQQIRERVEGFATRRKLLELDRSDSFLEFTQ